MKTWIRKALMAASLVLSGMLALPSQAVVPSATDMQALVAGGQLFLLNKFVVSTDTAVVNGKLSETATAVAALLETGKYNSNAADAAYKTAIDRGINYIKSFAKPLPNGNGGVYDANDTYVNGLCLVALSLYGEQAAKQADAAYNKIVDDAMTYAVNAQYTTGGWGYSAGGGPDMSNTQFAAMGLYYGSRYRNVTIDPTVATGWSFKFYTYLKAEQAADGHFHYNGTGDATNLAMTGAGLWSLAMIGKGSSTDTEAAKAIAWFANDDSSGLVAGWSGHNYYMIYAAAKALAATLGPTNKLGGATGRMWADDLSTALFAQVDIASGVDCPPAGAGEHRWCDNLDLGYYGQVPTMATAFMLQALAFSNASTEVVSKILVPDPVPPPVPGLVTLHTTGGVTITAAARGNAAQARAAATVKLPLGTFDFTLNHVAVGGTAVLTLTPPDGALDKNNPDSFVKADGTLKPNIKWYKIAGGDWNGSAVPIEIDLVAKVIRVTLKDGGPEDADHTADGKIVDPGAPGFDTAEGGSGSSGWGCSMGLNNGPIDPTLPLLVVAALAYWVRRRRA
jgi:hypothetical protein